MPPAKADWSSKWLTKTKPRRWKLPRKQSRALRLKPLPLPLRKLAKVADPVVAVAVAAVAVTTVVAAVAVATIVVATATRKAAKN